MGRGGSSTWQAATAGIFPPPRGESPRPLIASICRGSNARKTDTRWVSSSSWSLETSVGTDTYSLRMASTPICTNRYFIRITFTPSNSIFEFRFAELDVRIRISHEYQLVSNEVGAECLQCLKLSRSKWTLESSKSGILGKGEAADRHVKVTYMHVGRINIC